MKYITTSMDSLVLIIIVANVLISYKGFQDPTFLNTYKFQIGPILNGDKIRLLSSAFLHADYIHLGFNMYALYLFSGVVLHTVGGLLFLVVYLGSLLAGNLFSLFYHKNEPYYSAVGASGAVSGIVYSAILIYPDMTLILFPVPIPLPGYVFGIGYLLYTIYGMKKQLGNIGHSAHLGGAIGGFVLTLVLRPGLLFENTLMVVLLTIPIALVLLLQKRGKL